MMVIRKSLPVPVLFSKEISLIHLNQNRLYMSLFFHFHLFAGADIFLNDNSVLSKCREMHTFAFEMFSVADWRSWP